MSAEITLGTLGGEYMESAVLVEWRAADGARVAAGDVVAVVETAKAATDIEAPEAGVLRILVPAGDEVAVGTVLARIGEAVPAGPAGRASPAGAAPAAAPAGLARRWPEAYASPLAKRLAAARGIDLRQVRGSGPDGRIVRADLPETVRPAAERGFRIALDMDATALRLARAARWDSGERPRIGEIVADAARATLNAAGLDWPVVLDEDAPPADALAVIDLATFGIAEFSPPYKSCRAVLGLAAPSAGMLHLALAADADRLACTEAARFLVMLRATLENPADA